MNFRTLAKHPIQLAVMAVLAGYAGGMAQAAQDLSVNTLTLDTATGKSIGNVSRSGDMKTFFHMQKDMVLSTLKHLGIKVENLSPRLQQEISKPQTTNAKAFAAFSQAVDKADKGQFAQAAKLFNQAAKIDPGFGLAKGMASMMPKFDLAQGETKKVIAEMKAKAKEDSKKNAEQLSNAIDNKEKSQKDGDNKPEKLAKEEGSEGERGEIKKELDEIGLSDEGDDGGFDLGNPDDTDPNKIETAATDEDGASFFDPLQIAGNLGGDEPPLPELPTGLPQQLNDTLDNAANDQARESVTEPTPPDEPEPEPTPAGSGIWGSIVGNTYRDGASQQTLNEDSGNLQVVLTENGSVADTLDFTLSNGQANVYRGALLGANEGYETYAFQIGDGATLITGYRYVDGGEGVYEGQLAMVGVQGVQTAQDALPSSGQQVFSMLGVQALADDFYAVDSALNTGRVDWGTGKALSRIANSEYSDGFLLVGNVNRDTVSLDFEHRGSEQDDTYEPYGQWRASLNMRLYGNGQPLLGAGRFTVQGQDAYGVASFEEHGTAVLTLNESAAAAAYTPAEGETWHGFTSAILTYCDSCSYNIDNGTVEFTFNPDYGTVSSTFSAAEGTYFQTSAEDANAAFINKDWFGGFLDDENGQSSTFSTQGDYAGAGWDDLSYTSMGYWSHAVDTGEGIFHAIRHSTWVAGQLTLASVLDNQISGTLTYTGKILGGLVADDGGYSQYVSHMSGTIDLAFDFDNRGIYGGLSLYQDYGYGSYQWLRTAFDLQTDGYGGVWSGNYYQGSFNASLDGGEGAAYGELEGYFFGPNAEETGGRLTVRREYDYGEGYYSLGTFSGVYAARQGEWSDDYTEYPIYLGSVYSSHNNGIDSNSNASHVSLIALGGQPYLLWTDAGVNYDSASVYRYQMSANTISLDLDAWYEVYTYPNYNKISEINMSTGEFDESATTLANRNYRQWSPSLSPGWTASAYEYEYSYTLGTSVNNESFNSFDANKSFIQYSPQHDVYRYYFMDSAGQNLAEGIIGNKSTVLPTSGVSTYDWHQSGVQDGDLVTSIKSGKDGDYPGRLYVNWDTGMVVGYNTDAGAKGGGLGLYVGRVNTQNGTIEGGMEIQPWVREDAFAVNAFSRDITDENGATLQLYGNAGTPGGLGGMFVTDAEGTDLFAPTSTGAAQITGMLNRDRLAASYEPVAGEVWNGFAVAYATNRTTGKRSIVTSSDATQVSITYGTPSEAGRHVHGHIEVDTEQTLDGASVLPGATVDIVSDNEPNQDADSVSMYVNTKAFVMGEEVPTDGGGEATMKIIVAMPEAFDETEAANYEYTTWGVWSGDFGSAKEVAVSAHSQWIAGKLTPVADMPQSGTATYSGQVYGQVGGTQSGYVQGTLNMTTNFAARTVGGSMNNLNFKNGNTWVANAAINGSWAQGTVKYNATLTGTGASGNAAGAFYGPGAIETGGQWVIHKTDGSSGAGIFAGKQVPQ